MAKDKKTQNARIIHDTLANSVNVVIHEDDKFGTIHSSLAEPIVLNYFFGDPNDPEHRMAVMVPANSSVTFSLDDGEVIEDVSSKRYGID